MLAGQTTTVGNASSSSIAASACTVLPSPCSSAMKVRRRAEGVAHARALERVQLAAELEAVQLRVLGVRERDRLGGALELVRELLEQLAGRLLDVDLGVGLDELGELRRERGVGRHGDAPRGVAQEEAPRPVRPGAPRTARGRRSPARGPTMWKTVK